MAPKVKANKSNMSVTATPTVETKKEVPNKKPKTGTSKGTKKENRSRGTAARNDFLMDVAMTSELTVEQTKKAIDGLRTIVGRNLKEKGTARIPTIMTMRMKTVPAREASTKTICGVEKKLKARPVETKRIMMSPLDELKGAV